MFRINSHLIMRRKKPNRRLIILAFASLFISTLCLPQSSNADDAHINALIEVLVERGIIPAGDVDAIKAAVDRKVARMPSSVMPSGEVSEGVVESNSGVKIKIGAGMRISTKILSDDTPDKQYSYDTDLDDARIYMTGQVNDKLGIEFNIVYDSSNSSSMRVMDAVAKYHINDSLNVWAGRHLPPSDRSNLDGPYYIVSYEYPGLVSRYPAIFAGRDDGVMINGEILEEAGRLKYAVGAYKGLTSAPNVDGNLLYAGRLTYNFWDPEPGYYTTSTYYGDKDVLALSVVSQYQTDGVANGANYKAANVDLLMEKNFDFGTITLEGAAYTYDLDGASGHGDAYMGLIAYLFPNKVGPGQFQPHVRYQDFQGSQKLDAGVNYVIKGHNMRFSLIYSSIETSGSDTTSQVLFGGQFQI